MIAISPEREREREAYLGEMLNLVSAGKFSFSRDGEHVSRLLMIINEYRCDVSHLRYEIERVANAVMKHYPDEPGAGGTSESACDVAVRLIERLAAVER